MGGRAYMEAGRHVHGRFCVTVNVVVRIALLLARYITHDAAQMLSYGIFVVERTVVDV